MFIVVFKDFCFFDTNLINVYQMKNTTLDFKNIKILLLKNKKK